jgi:glycosyltransferase involved in cell wall biosynthesis
LRILMVIPHVFAGGAEKAALHLARELNNLGSRVSICTLSLDLRYLPDCFRHLDYILPSRPIQRSKIEGVTDAVVAMVRETYALAKLLRRYASGYDIIDAGNVPAYWATYLCRNGKPIVWTCSEVFGPYDGTMDVYLSNLVFRSSLKSAAAFDSYVVRKGVNVIVTCSEFNKRLVFQRYGRNSQVINPGVDYHFFSQKIPDAAEKIGVQGEPILLHVGSLVRRKNQLVSIRALKLIKEEYKEAKLIIVGTGPWKKFLLEEVRSLGLDGDVLFMDSVSEEMLRLLYNACDINLYPVQGQTWGLVPFEALAAGKPSIVSGDSGAGEVIQREGIGFTIRDASPRSVADAVKYVLKHDDEKLDVVARGRKYVAENLSCRAYAEKIRAFFEKVLMESTRLSRFEQTW